MHEPATLQNPSVEARDDEVLDAALAAHPNDAYFKAVFSKIENACAFFRRHLPAAAASLLDWTTLALQPGSFVKGSLQQVHSDLVFSVKADRHEVLLYLLFEHQTTVDPTMPLRLLGYITEMLLTHEKEHGLPLPPVLPFVLHQGPDRWTASTDFKDLFALPEGMLTTFGPFLPQFRHGLLDLSQFDPAREEDQGPLRVVLQLMKLAREKRMLDFFDWLAKDFASQLSDSLLRTCLVYAFNVDSRLDLEQIARRMDNNRTLQSQTMSIAQKLIAQGREQGQQQGYVLGALKICLRLVRHKWGALPEDVLARIDSLSYTQLEQFSEDLLDMTTVKDLQDWLDNARAV